jgi:hypothetical protein
MLMHAKITIILFLLGLTFAPVYTQAEEQQNAKKQAATASQLPQAT